MRCTHIIHVGCGKLSSSFTMFCVFVLVYRRKFMVGKKNNTHTTTTTKRAGKQEQVKWLFFASPKVGRCSASPSNKLSIYGFSWCCCCSVCEQREYVSTKCTTTHFVCVFARTIFDMAEYIIGQINTVFFSSKIPERERKKRI